jgi:predicted nuclease of predicted toxin-antitoxin system
LKLLFDHNLSPRLVSLLSDLFPQSEHVFQLGMAETDDQLIWTHAKANNFVIVSKDSDFVLRSLLQGPPPKVIHVDLGNCPTLAVEALLRANIDLIRQLDASQEKACLTLPD